MNWNSPVALAAKDEARSRGPGAAQRVSFIQGACWWDHVAGCGESAGTIRYVLLQTLSNEALASILDHQRGALAGQAEADAAAGVVGTHGHEQPRGGGGTAIGHSMVAGEAAQVGMSETGSPISPASSAPATPPAGAGAAGSPHSPTTIPATAGGGEETESPSLDGRRVQGAPYSSHAEWLLPELELAAQQDVASVPNQCITLALPQPAQERRRLLVEDVRVTNWRANRRQRAKVQAVQGAMVREDIWSSELQWLQEQEALERATMENEEVLSAARNQQRRRTSSSMEVLHSLVERVHQRRRRRED